MASLRVAVVSFRLGGLDGVSVEAGKWIGALRELGHEVWTVAGDGPVDRPVRGLGPWSGEEPDRRALGAALEGADVVVAENICSLPLNVAASDATATALEGRPAVLHHHDLAWQRSWERHDWPVPDDPRWVHVTVNDLSRRQLADRRVAAVREWNRFNLAGGRGDRRGVRDALGVKDDEVVVLQPTRAIPRKNVSGGLALAEALGATYWLTGPVEEGYGPELERLVTGARVPVVRRPVADMADAYAACDVVVLPSHWEGFGNPAVEGWLHDRPVAIGSYPVADELRAIGFSWFGLEDAAAITAWLAADDRSLVDANRRAAARHLDLAELPTVLDIFLVRARGRVPAASGASGADSTAQPAASCVNAGRRPGGGARGVDG